jgi:hypothetical protein
VTFRFTPRKAQEAGWNVQDIMDSWQAALLAERDKQRDNPQLYAARSEKLSLAVKQVRGASCVTWETLNELPHGIPTITVSATSFDAARNSMSLDALLEQRMKTKLAAEFCRVGLYRPDMEGRRAATAKAIEAEVWVADLGLAS